MLDSHLKDAGIALRIRGNSWQASFQVKGKRKHTRITDIRWCRGSGQGGTEFHADDLMG